MPIRPENRARYPKDWPAISRRIRDRAENRCEGSPAFPDCRAENGAPHPVTGSRVVLTVAHLDHQPENCADDNLKAWCQRCHNTYDMPMRRRGIAERAKAAKAHAEMFAIAAAEPLPANGMRGFVSPMRIADAALPEAIAAE